MKTSLLFVLLITIFLLTPVSINSQWVRTNGPGGGYVNTYFVNGSTVYAGTLGGGVFETKNNGAAWTSISEGLPNNNASIYSIGMQGTNLFAGIWEEGAFRSTDNGLSWTIINNGLTNLNVQAYAVIGSYLFAGTYGGGVFRSTDFGSTWTAASTGMGENGDVQCLAVNGTTLFAGTWAGGIFRTTNNGTSWVPVSSGLPTFANIPCMTVSGTTIYAGTAHNGVFRSTNNGISWTAVTNGMPFIQIYSLAATGTTVYCGTVEGLYKSTNSGTNWSQAPMNTGVNTPYIYALAIQDTKLYASVMRGGNFISTDAGSTWSEINTGFVNSEINAFEKIGNSLFAAANGGVYLSNNNGTTWNTVTNGLTDNIILALKASGETLFAGTEKGVFKSTNLGSNWTAVNTGLPSVNAFARTLAVSPDGGTGTLIFAGVSNDVYVTSNFGTSWLLASSGIPDAIIMDLTVVYTGPSSAEIFTATFDGIYRTTNYGASWSSANNGIPVQNFYSIASFGNNLFIGGADGTVYRSTNKGASWTFANSGLPVRTIESLFAQGENIFAGTYGSGFYYSTNSGDTWLEGNNGLTNIYVMAVFVHGTTVFAGTQFGGVWSIPIFQVPVELTSFTAQASASGITLKWSTSTETNNKGFEVQRKSRDEDFKTLAFVSGKGNLNSGANYEFEDATIPDGKNVYRLKQLDLDGSYEYSKEIETEGNPYSYSLGQNYPNPFNPSTTINITLASEANVTVKIYNNLGELVAFPINGKLSAGSQLIKFDASLLPSGTYLYRMEAVGTDGSHFSSVKKMMLIK